MNTTAIGFSSLQKISERIKSLFFEDCRRILIINIPQVDMEDFDIATAKLGRYPCFPPYGPGLLSRCLHIAGYEAKLIDLNFAILSKVSRESFRYELWQDLLLKTMKSFRPDLIGISCMFSMAHNSMKATAKFVRKHYPNVPIIAGGVHASNNTYTILGEVPEIDIIISYEADKALVTLIDFINNKESEDKLSQIATLVNGEFIQITKRDTPNGDCIDYRPKYDDLPIDQYNSVGRIGVYSWLRTDKPKVGSILSTRGCRGNCTFCSVRGFNGKSVRSRTPSAVVDEIQEMYEYGISHFMWLDDDLFRPSAIELFNEISRRNLRITWDASNAVIASASTPEIIHAAAGSGCIGLSFGIESGNPDILRLIKKPSGLKHFLKIGEILKKYPEIFSKGFLMVGFPGETVGQIWDTINLALEIKLDWYPIQIVSPFSGTRIANNLVEKGVIDEHTLLSSKMFVGPTGEQRLKEKREIHSSSFMIEMLDLKNHIPTPEEMPDIWFFMDYVVNYPRILKQTDTTKLKMKRLMLRDVCDRVPRHIPMASLFLGVANQKLGNIQESEENFKETSLYINESAFWQVRFERLGLTKFLQKQTC